MVVAKIDCNRFSDTGAQKACGIFTLMIFSMSGRLVAASEALELVPKVVPHEWALAG